MTGDFDALDRAAALVDKLAGKFAAADGLNWEEQCPYEVGETAETAECDSSTCVAVHYDDHDPTVARANYRRYAQIALVFSERVAGDEAMLAAARAADPEAKPEGTREALAVCATMLEQWMPECFPVDENGQVHFARCMTDATAAEIRAFLETPVPAPGVQTGGQR